MSSNILVIFYRIDVYNRIVVHVVCFQRTHRVEIQTPCFGVEAGTGDILDGFCQIVGIFYDGDVVGDDAVVGDNACRRLSQRFKIVEIQDVLIGTVPVEAAVVVSDASRCLRGKCDISLFVRQVNEQAASNPVGIRPRSFPGGGWIEIICLAGGIKVVAVADAAFRERIVNDVLEMYLSAIEVRFYGG